MYLRPCLNEPALRNRKTATEALKRINREDSRLILIVSVKMRTVVLATGLDEHPDDDSEEPREFRHNLLQVQIGY